MSVERLEVRAGAYHDSVTLMQAGRRLAQDPGVLAAQLAMGTELNRDVLIGMGFAVPAGTGPADLLVAIRAQDADALAAAFAHVAEVLTVPSGGAGSSTGAGPAVAFRTVGSAVRATGAGLALVSVPGEHAFTEAMDALEHGAHVMVFSDNVPVEQEVRLKAEGAALGLLVMGPDCGTAVVSGVGLGFANVVRPGPVGIVAASGTGAQQLLCLLDGVGVGVSHCLGVGGRDLSAAVGGASTRQALALLDADPGCELIVVVSKPPDPAVEREVRALAAVLATPVVFALLGGAGPDLTRTAQTVAERVGAAWAPPGRWPAPTAPTARYTTLRGAFCGGTLCDEAMLIASARLGPIASNVPLAGAPRLDDLGSTAGGHVLVDFGDDDLTRGRPHPMIDGSLRADWIARQGATQGRPGQGLVLLLDVVLGHGAHPDPAAELAGRLEQARATAAARGVETALVVSLCGSGGDPQGLVGVARALQRSGASVHLSNADAARAAVELIDPGAAR